jgi:hypothetical protein
LLLQEQFSLILILLPVPSWETRHQAAIALMARYPGKKMMATDVCVPISELAGALQHARKTIEAYGIKGTILGYVVDGERCAGLGLAGTGRVGRAGSPSLLGRWVASPASAPADEMVSLG